MSQTVEVDVGEARRILNVDQAADADTIRDAHRREIRRAHPDAGGSEAGAQRVNAAFDVLRDMEPADPPAVAAPAEPPTAGPPLDVDHYFVVDSAPADLLLRIADAGHEVGEVVFVDPQAGLLEIVVGDAPAVGQLAVAVGVPSDEGTEVSFTLEPLGITPAPPIGPVVEALMAAVRR